MKDRDDLPDRAAIKAKAAEMWAALTDNERHGVRFGLFPQEQMQAAEAAGFVGRARLALVGALMDCAEKDGGMLG